MLAADPDLHYNPETGKFYKLFSGTTDFSTAQANAASESLNFVNGQLVTIRSATEQALVEQLAADAGTNIWLGVTDATVEGEWRWLSGGDETDQFWEGGPSGYNVDGAYTNWFLVAGKTHRMPAT